MAEELRAHWQGEENGVFTVMAARDEMYADYVAPLDDIRFTMEALLDLEGLTKLELQVAKVPEYTTGAFTMIGGVVLMMRIRRLIFRSPVPETGPLPSGARAMAWASLACLQAASGAGAGCCSRGCCCCCWSASSPAASASSPSA